MLVKIILCVVLILNAVTLECLGSQSSLESCGPKFNPLPVLPGRGWDNLRNREMGQITALTYTECKTTPDGVFHIPDNTFVIPVKESSLKVFSDFIENWSNYVSVDARSFSASAEGSFTTTSISGSFSSDYQETKQKQHDEQTVTSRIYVRNTIYSIYTDPNIKIDSGFKSQLDGVIKELKLNNTQKATVLLQLIVRDFGTHYLSRLDAGGILLQEDYLLRSWVQASESNISGIKAAASISFFGSFGGSLGYTHSSSSTMTDGYLKNLQSSNVRAYGGSPLKTTITNATDRWVDSLMSNLVPVDRFGDPLHFFINPYHFPEHEMDILAVLQDKLKEAIDQYIMYNTHVGCTTDGSPNFEFSANVDDKSCKSPYNNYTFGGTFVQCVTERNDLNVDLCGGELQVKNYLTGGYSCPPGFDEMLLRSKTRTVHYEYFHWWFIHRYQDIEITLSSHWCYKHGNVSEKTGVMFGGTYTSKVNNPLTQAKSCPPTFEDVLLTPDFHICEGTDYELGYRFSIPFGGFFSCQYGNPLYDIVVKRKLNKNLKMSNSGNYPNACPTGCSQHTGIVDESCMINYCVKANSISVHGPTKINLPPFVDISTLYAQSPMNFNAGGLSAGSIVAICISSILLIGLTVVPAILYLRRKRSNANGNARSAAPSDGSTERLIGNTENDAEDDEIPGVSNPGTTVIV